MLVIQYEYTISSMRLEILYDAIICILRRYSAATSTPGALRYSYDDIYSFFIVRGRSLRWKEVPGDEVDSAAILSNMMSD